MINKPEIRPFTQQDQIFYHGTHHAFNEFLHSADIGFHFGSKKAAKDRLSRLAGDIPKITTISQKALPSTHPHVQAYQILRQTMATSLSEALFAVIASRSDAPHADLARRISTLRQDEQVATLQEYQEKPLSTRFLQNALTSTQPDLIKVFYGQEWVSSASTPESAERIKGLLKTQHMKHATLSCRTMVTLPDLGTWSPENIAMHLPLSQTEKDALYAKPNKDAQLDYLRTWFASQGVDGIVYRNAVEHSGSNSYIVFDPQHIHLTGPVIPPACPHAEQLSKRCNALYKEFERVLESKQICAKLVTLLNKEWSQIEDWYTFIDKLDIPAALFNAVKQDLFAPLRQIPVVLSSPELTAVGQPSPLETPSRTRYAV